MGEFYKNLRILSQELYRKSSNTSYAPVFPNMTRENSISVLGIESSVKIRDKLSRASSSRNQGEGHMEGSAQRQPSSTSVNIDTTSPGNGIPHLLNRSSSSRNILDSTIHSLNTKFSTSPVSEDKDQQMSERILTYVKESGLPKEFFERYSRNMTQQDDSTKDTPSSNLESKGTGNL